MKAGVVRLFAICISCLSVTAFAQRSVQTLQTWKFSKADLLAAETVSYDDSSWEDVSVPHDWAIYGPFDRKHDLQTVVITQNLEKKSSVKTGRTGGLPYAGVGWYRTRFDVEPGKCHTLIFDGAMSRANVFVNGKKACFWPYGYNSFFCDISGLVNKDGKGNVLAVRLENLEKSSRWYPGAGLYRNVHVVSTEKIHVGVWGTYVTTPRVGEDFASVKIEANIENSAGEEIEVSTEIVAPDGSIVAKNKNRARLKSGDTFTQNFIVEKPLLWSPDTPHLYWARSQIYAGGKLVDKYSTRFGIRKIEYIAYKGFYLNGKPTKFQGVCNHHDLGPLGAAVNVAALRHQLTLLKDMGCNAIRTSHNMPAPELVRLCDEMGFMMMIEPFDEWDIQKCKNGYHLFFDDWARKDMQNMLRQYRNNPCVVMWSIGNEVPNQCSKDGYKVAEFLRDICRREDPTRPVTCGMNSFDCALKTGFAAVLDIPGLNYNVRNYLRGYKLLPQKIMLGSETASTVSSRGVYKFPVKRNPSVRHEDHQSSSYDLEYCNWSNIPDFDFALAEDYEWYIGQFVWTGFDYLGEPYPYDTDAWPSHSSLFGIIDLASIPKDRYYLYRSIWNKKEKTLHVLPHWNWEGKEGQKIPVFVYTNYPSAELFINGKSFGVQRKSRESLERRFRLMWFDAVYEPGQLKVVAYDENGKPAAQKIVNTAGAPYRLELSTSSKGLSADGKDLAYVTVKVVDKDGNLCPLDNRLVKFKTAGAASYRAAANGDPTSLELFHLPQMRVFSGMLTVILQASRNPGECTLEASADGVKPGKIALQVK